MLAACLMMLSGLAISPAPTHADEPIRVVVHMNMSDPEAQAKGLKNVVNLLREDPSVEVVVVCHGGGISILQRGVSPHAEVVSSLQGQSVLFLACRNTMKERNLTPDQLLDRVDTVASGTYEVIRRQKQGYAYFKP